MTVLPSDPLDFLRDNVIWTPEPNVWNDDCFICNDPDFARLGLPLCKECSICGAHTAADCFTCDNGHFQG